MKRALKNFLDALDAISVAHRETSDTEVFEAVSDALENAYVHPKMGYVFPQSFGMFTPAGDALARAALFEFITAAEASGAFRLSPEQRRNAFQDSSVTSAAGHTYRKYFPDFKDESYFDKAKARDEYFGFKRQRSGLKRG